MKILKKNPHFKKVKKAVLKLYKLLKIMSKKQSVQESQAHVLFKRGVSYYADNLTAAEKPLQKALTIYQRLEKKSKTYTFNVATTLYNLACVFQETNRTKKAESSYTKALKMYRALAQEDSETYTSYVAMTLHSLGLLYWKKRNFQ
ncbi:MAG: tetratricopeptide repeat protein, partial [Theionarchaea archaeon]|nr:tetratricopeptide repeat protein [Theionarchaea archaeon]